jgi:hypothetical protein
MHHNTPDEVMSNTVSMPNACIQLKQERFP